MAKKKKGYQSGRTVNPRAAGAAAMRRNAPKPKRRIRFEGPDWSLPRGNGDGRWAAGSTVETVENYNDQVKRKYGGGSVTRKQGGGDPMWDDPQMRRARKGILGAAKDRGVTARQGPRKGMKMKKPTGSSGGRGGKGG